MVTNSNIRPEYFWDEMTIKEANAVIDSVAENNRTTWEQTRWLAYIQALTQGANIKTPADLIKFNWEVDSNSLEATKDNRTNEEVRNSLIAIKNSLI